MIEGQVLDSSFMGLTAFPRVMEGIGIETKFVS